MEAKYTTKSGKILSAYLYNDVLEGNLWHNEIEMSRVIHKKKCKPFMKKLFSDASGTYVVYDGIKLYLNDFDYKPAEKLVSDIEKYLETRDYTLADDDDIWATIMKETDKLAFIIDLPIFTTIIPQLGIALSGSDEMTVLCVPTEKHYKKSDWGYKLTVEAMNPDYRKVVASRDFYFSDFCSLIRSGMITVVLKDKYIREHNKKLEERRKISYKLKKLFIKKEEGEVVLV